ncbi:DotU/TssL family secretion system protein [Cupriavidus necator]|uniref:DotU family type IV/VI secretion system protein n=1 Tax=Cupriavidus necator TaxID=106590 RepID=UPI00339D8CB7
MMFPLALRDTALTVTALADAAQPMEGFATFRAKCVEQVARLREEFHANGQPADVVEDAAYAQCALLDEVALRRLQGADRDAWEREPLQVQQFKSHDAGEALITRIERRLAEPQPVLPLLTVFHTVLGLGFQGRYALEGASARTALIRAIDERLERAGMGKASGPVLVTVGTPRRWLSQMSPLGWVVVACIGAGLVYLGLDRWLAAAIARLAG